MFELQILGGVALKRDGAPLAGRALQPRRVALLAILAANGALGVSRDRLLALLWPEKDETDARHALSQWLFLMRRDLEVGDLMIGATQLRLNPERIVADVQVFDAAIAAKDDATAATVYRGPFLDGFFLNDAPEFSHWLDRERDRRHAAALGAVEATARVAEAKGDLTTAIAQWRRVVTLDPLSGRGVRNLMSALASSGDTAAALHVASSHETALRHELDAAPSPQVAGLAARLRSSDTADAPTRGPGVDVTREDPYLLHVRDRLRARYAVERIVARTSTVTQFDARDVATNTAVALRVLLPDITARVDTGLVVATLERASRVRHPNVAPISDVGAVEQVLFTSAPPVSGELLRDRLDREPQLPLALAIDITLDVVAALECAEQYELPHLDITPRRVRLVSGTAMLTDLGLMHGIISGQRHDATESGVAMGTPAYMSPELLAGDGESGRLCDIYSVACLLFHMIAGHPPHHAPTSRALLARRLREPAPLLRDARAGVSDALDTLVQHALARRAGDRLQHAQELHERLRVFRDAISAG